MKMQLIVFVLLHEFAVFAHNCRSGEITGIHCTSSQDIIKEYKPKIDQASRKIQTILRIFTGQVRATSTLIDKNIADAYDENMKCLVETRKMLSLANNEAIRAPIKIKTCVSRQSRELTKISLTPIRNCSNTLTSLNSIISELIKLKQSVAGLPLLCKSLNPLYGEIMNLRSCLNKQLATAELQIIQLQKEFEDSVKTAVNLSVQCIMRESGLFHEKVGRVVGALKNCKNFSI